jgi:hypothetical protein
MLAPPDSRNYRKNHKALKGSPLFKFAHRREAQSAVSSTKDFASNPVHNAAFAA